MKKILLVLAVSLSFNALVSCKKNNKTSSSLSSSISSIQHTSSSIISSSESSSNIVVSILTFTTYCAKINIGR